MRLNSAPVLLWFLSFIFCMMEAARVMNLWNTLQEVPVHRERRRPLGFHRRVRQQSAAPACDFRDSPRKLMKGDPVSDAYIHINYLSLVRASEGRLTLAAIPAGALPPSPANHVVACQANLNSPRCIQFVRVCVCPPGSDFNARAPVECVPLLPLIQVPSMTLPILPTIAMAKTPDYRPGQPFAP